MERHNDFSRPKAEHKQVHVIEGPHDLEIRIMESSDPRPRYSINIGHKRKVPDEFNRLTSFVQVRVNTSQDGVTVDDSTVKAFQEAHDWIKARVEENKDKYKFEDRRPPRREPRSFGGNDYGRDSGGGYGESEGRRSKRGGGSRDHDRRRRDY